MSHRRSGLRVGPWFVTALLLAAAGTASADDAATQRAADDRFQEGKALLAQGEVAAACLKFEQSLTLLRRGGTLLNLAVCREKEGRQATAMRLYQEAVQAAITDKRPDREKLARERLADVRTKVSWIEIKLADGAAVPGLVVRCDEQPISAESWGSPLAFDAGTHHIVATAPGYTPFEVSVTLATPGEHRAVTLSPLTPEAPPPAVTASASAAPTAAPIATSTATVAPSQTASLPPTATVPGDADGPTWRRPAGIAGVAVGLAGAALGVAFGVKAIGDNDATKRLCPGDVCPGPEGIARNQDARTAALVADISLPVGIVAAGIGVYLLVTSRAPRPTFEQRRPCDVRQSLRRERRRGGAGAGDWPDGRLPVSARCLVNPRGSRDIDSGPSASTVRASSAAAPPWLPRVALLAGLGLSCAACEVLIGIPDVTLDTGSTTGEGGTGTGGAPCAVEPCVGDACTEEELANGKDVVEGAGGATGSNISGLTARDGVVHWGIDRMPGGFLVRTTSTGATTKEPTSGVSRRLADDGENVYWSAVYSACLGIAPSLGGKPAQMGTCVSTASDRSPGVALDASNAYWTVSRLDDCDAIPGCCDGNLRSCLLGAAKGASVPTVVAGGRNHVSDVVRVGTELFFATHSPPGSAAIERCPAEAKACSPAVFQETLYSDAPVVLVAARGFVYWSTPAGIIRRKSVAAPQSSPEDVAFDAYVNRSMVATRRGRPLFFDDRRQRLPNVARRPGGDSRDRQGSRHVPGHRLRERLLGRRLLARAAPPLANIRLPSLRSRPPMAPSPLRCTSVDPLRHVHRSELRRRDALRRCPRPSQSSRNQADSLLGRSRVAPSPQTSSSAALRSDFRGCHPIVFPRRPSLARWGSSRLPLRRAGGHADC